MAPIRGLNRSPFQHGIDVRVPAEAKDRSHGAAGGHPQTTPPHQQASFLHTSHVAGRPPQASAVAIAPGNATTWYAASLSGTEAVVSVSHDSGRTWAAVTSGS